MQLFPQEPESLGRSAAMLQMHSHSLLTAALAVITESTVSLGAVSLLVWAPIQWTHFRFKLQYSPTRLMDHWIVVQFG